MISDRCCVICDWSESDGSLLPGCDQCYNWQPLFDGVEVWKLLLQVGNLWRVVIDDVRIVGMEGSIVLVVSLSGIKTLQSDDLSYDAAREDFGIVELRDIRLGNSFLLLVAVKNG